MPAKFEPIQRSEEGGPVLHIGRSVVALFLKDHFLFAFGQTGIMVDDPSGESS